MIWGGASTYFLFNGTPWGKQAFKIEAEQYMKRNSFKDGTYYASFDTKAGQHTVVSVISDNQFYRVILVNKKSQNDRCF